MFCYKCGYKNDEAVRYCSKCGTLLGGANDEKPKGKGNNVWKIVLISIASILGFVFLCFVGLIIWICALAVDEATDDSSDGYAQLELNDASISFKLPNGFYGVDGNSPDYQEYENSLGDYITYEIDYAADDYLMSEFKYSKKVFDVDYPGSKFGKYSTNIGGANVNAYYFDYKDLGSIFRETYAFYPISDDYYVKIILGIEGVTKNNLDDYVMIGDKTFDL